MPTHAHIKPKKGKNSFLDAAVSVMAIIGPLFGLPQVVQIYAGQSADGVSLWSWLGFTVYTLVFLAYGITYKLRPVIIAQALWLCIYVLVISGILLYG